MIERICLLSVLIAVVTSTCAAAGVNSRPHIVTILVDDMGYGDPQCYNPDSKIRTPAIDSLAAAGMRFTDAHAAGPLCHMSRYGLMTGRYPFRTNVSLWPKQPLIEEGQMTVASMLKQQGYHTAMVGKWHLGFRENGYENPLPGGPIHVGFDSFFGIRASTDIPPYFYIRNDRAVQPPTVPIAAGNSEGWSPIQGAFWREGLIASDLQLKDVLPRFTQEAVNVIQTHAQKDSDQPLMLYLAYPAPHTPWLPSPEFAGKSRAGMYGDFMEMVDANVGTVLKSLQESGLADNTLLIFSSDNGPTWYETDVERFQHDSSGGWRGMKADAWEAGHRVPFIVRWPGVVKAGSRSAQTIDFTDVLATLAAVTGGTLGANDAPDSFDFSPALRGTQTDKGLARKSILIQSGAGFMTVRKDGWKLIEGLGSGGFSEPRRIRPEPGQPNAQLYNLNDDPEEANDLFTTHPEKVRELRQLITTVREAKGHRLVDE